MSYTYTSYTTQAKEEIEKRKAMALEILLDGAGCMMYDHDETAERFWEKGEK